MKWTILALAALLSACKGLAGQVPQQNLCAFEDDASAKKCVPGELAFFQPDRWGNERMPLTVVALYCNTNHQVIFNGSGVICIFTNERFHLFK